MQTTTTATIFDQFRQQVYRHALGFRKDSLFELLEATLTTPDPTTLVRLSLALVFRRRWPSAPDALADGSLDLQQVRVLLHTQLAAVPFPGRPVWVVDGTIWPRPAAVTSPERTWGHRAIPGITKAVVVPAWEYQWVVAVPVPGSSWILPLEVDRRNPSEATPTTLALRQLRSALGQRPAAAARPVVTFDSNYDAVALAQAVQSEDPAQRLDADVLVRLAKRRRFYRPPPPYAGKGRPRKHGAVFRLGDPGSHGLPDRSASSEDPRYGQVQVDVWEGLHAQRAAATPLTVVRVQVERLPQAGRKPGPWWLVWAGGPLPEDLLELWRWYALRFTVEHGFRFLKQELGWTTVRLRAPEAADRWSWLLVLAWYELWLARSLVADQRLPWERPLPPERLTPGRVRRALVGLLAGLGTPTRAVRPRGKSPGRQLGERPGRRKRHPVVRRLPQAAT